MPGILVVNSGSTSLKLSLVDDDETSVPVGSLAEAGADSARGDVLGVAHRIVHGGGRFTKPVLLDGSVLGELRMLAELAPLHTGAALAAVEEAWSALPDVRHVAVFDTTFHATIPEEAATYAVPRRWAAEWGVRRYGFHGLSVQWAAERATASRLVVCHLGGGCSVTAVRDRRSVDTTMGFSPLDGVPMATRSGALDPQILLYLLRTRRLGLEDLEQALEHESGLLGVSGISPRVEELERSTEPAAALALDVFTHSVAAAVAAMTTSLGGLDALVFTGGVGENSSFVRARVCERLRFLGIELDADANESAVPDADVATGGSAVRVLVVAAREDVVAARAARRLVG